MALSSCEILYLTNRWRHISSWPVDPAVRPITRPVKKMPRWVESGWVFFPLARTLARAFMARATALATALLAGCSASRSYGLGCCNVGCFLCVCSMAYYSHGPSSYASVWDQFWVPCPFPVAIVHSHRVVSIGFCSTFPQILCLACIVIWSESIESN
jgi:hypothetical protein